MKDTRRSYFPGKDGSSPLFPAIVRTLLYFDIFNYPLKEAEIIRFLSTKVWRREDVTTALSELVSANYVYRAGEFFSVRKGDSIIKRREKGNLKAIDWMAPAAKRARLIGRFPFIRSVMISGSLSKGYMDEKSDVDFFIVTHPGRLWIARMLLVLFKRVFLLNSKRTFCINYFISSDHLRIDEQNLFTATELATVLPIYGTPYYDALMHENQWLKSYFPNYLPREITAAPPRQEPVKGILELLLNVCGGNSMDRWCRTLTMKRWERLYGASYSKSDFAIAFKSTRYASKSHPRNFQRKITVTLEERWQMYLKQQEKEPV